jgi:hypothetical protein
MLSVHKRVSGVVICDGVRLLACTVATAAPAAGMGAGYLTAAAAADTAQLLLQLACMLT